MQTWCGLDLSLWPRDPPLKIRSQSEEMLGAIVPMWTFSLCLFPWQIPSLAGKQNCAVSLFPSLFPSTFRKWGEGGSNSIPFPLSSSSPPSFCFLLAQRARATRAGGRDGERAAMPCHARAARSAQCTTTTTVLFSLLTAAGREGGETAGEGLLCLFGWQGIINSIFFSLSLSLLPAFASFMVFVSPPQLVTVLYQKGG